MDGLWGSWSPWSKCSKTCGGGTEEWSRNCDSPTPSHGGEYCQGKSTEVRLCNKNQCKLNYYFNPSFQNSPQSATNCNVGSVSGSWGSWTDWSKCSKSCAGGTETRRRLCDSPAPAHGGADCGGDDSQQRQCNTETCLKGKSIDCFTLSRMSSICHNHVILGTECSSDRVPDLSTFLIIDWVVGTLSISILTRSDLINFN